MFKINKKCNGIPIAENITAIPRPSGVLGIGAPKPKRNRSSNSLFDLFFFKFILQIN